MIEPARNIQFDCDSVFMLTLAGEMLVTSVLEQGLSAASTVGFVTDHKAMFHAGPIPSWDIQRRELRIGSIVVKRYCVPAENQEMILAAFEEEAWPTCIDDPLPPSAEIDPKRRLHSTIQCLNRNQKAHLLQFHGDGRGRGVRWELLSGDVAARA